MGRFETEILTQPQNLELLMNLPGMWVDKTKERKLLKTIILDMDSSVSPTYGNPAMWLSSKTTKAQQTSG